MRDSSNPVKPENTQADAYIDPQTLSAQEQSPPAPTPTVGTDESEHRYLRLQQQNRTIIHLSTHPAVAEGRLDQALNAIAEAATEAIRVTRTNIWRLDADEGLCRCLISIETGSKAHLCDCTLEIQNHPEYFAALQGGPVLEVRDVKNDPRTATLTQIYWEPQHIISCLIAPIRMRGRIAGLVCFEHILERTWYPEEATFASQIAALVAQVFLNADIRRRAHELSIITRISREIASVHDLRQVLESIARHVMELAQTDVCGVFVQRPNDEIITVAQGVSKAFIEMLHANSGTILNSAFIKRAVETDKPVQIADLTQSTNKLAQTVVQMENLHTVLIVPMLGQNQSAGGIVIGQRSPKYFSPETLNFLQAVAQQSVNAVESARLFASLREEKALLEKLYQLSQHTVKSFDIQEVAQRALDEICTILNVSKGVILLQSGPATEMLYCIAEVGMDQNERWPSETRPFLIGINVNDVLQEDWPAGHFEGAKDSISVNLPIGEQTTGVLTLLSTKAGQFGEDHLRFLELAAATITGALRNAQYFEEQHTQRALAEALAEAATVLGSTLDLEQVLDRILEQAAKVVDGNIFNILLISGEKGHFVRWRGYEQFGIPAETIAKTTVPVFEYPRLVQMIETGEPVLVRDIDKDPTWIRTNPYREHLRSYVAAPILITDKVEGFLNVNGIRVDQFSEKDAQRLKAFAGHAAAAIHNARLYQQQLQHADKLEQEVRKRTAQLEAQNAWLEAILSSTADGIIVTDGAGTIVQQNRIADAWLNETLSSEDAKILCDTVRDIALHAKEHSDMVLELPGLDLQLSAAPISAQGAEGSAIVVAVHDVSYLKALDRMKSRFISNVSHELRTPLTSIKLYSTLIRNSSRERKGQYLDSLESEANRLSTLVEDILQISHIESEGLTPNLQTLDLGELTGAIVANHKVLAESRQLDLSYHTEDDAIPVKVDPDKFIQVLNNLVENAIHYTPTGGNVQVSVGKTFRDEQAWGTITVQDTGIGIPEEEQPYIFDRFFRGENPQRMQIPGSGLGLAIVKEILELHGGNIQLESQVDVGSTFIVRIPLRPID